MGENDKLLGKLEEFVETHKDLHRNLEVKIDDLVSFKIRLITISSLCSLFISFLVSLIAKFT
jgi:hypothetical protein